MNTSPEDIDAVFAGEYVLGVLAEPERARVKARAAEDPEFARLLAFWNEHLTPLAHEIEPAPPPATLKRRVADSLFSSDTRRTKQRLRASRGFWRLATAAMTALALTAVAALFYVASKPPASAAPVMVAALAPSGATPVLTIEFDRNASLLRIRQSAIGRREGRAAEIWLIPEDGAPQSLGLLPSGVDATMPAPAALRSLLVPGAQLAVSNEAAGGSPSGAPTGPIIGAGPLVEY